MIHLRYKCNVNFLKLPLICIDLCLKLDNGLRKYCILHYSILAADVNHMCCTNCD
jgi:hypothetical protein